MEEALHSNAVLKMSLPHPRDLDFVLDRLAKPDRRGPHDDIPRVQNTEQTEIQRRRINKQSLDVIAVHKI